MGRLFQWPFNMKVAELISNIPQCGGRETHKKDQPLLDTDLHYVLQFLSLNIPDWWM